MQITLSPSLRATPLSLSVSVTNDTLTANGETVDFSGIPEGATLPIFATDWPWLASNVERVDGELRLALIFPISPSAPPQSRFPDVITVTEDGAVALPPYAVEEES